MVASILKSSLKNKYRMTLSQALRAWSDTTKDGSNDKLESARCTTSTAESSQIEALD